MTISPYQGLLKVEVMETSVDGEPGASCPLPVPGDGVCFVIQWVCARSSQVVCLFPPV